jgi:hypothetical protein
MPEPYQLERSLRADLAPLSRRRFLRWGLGVAAVAVGGFALLRRSPLDKTPLPAGVTHASLPEYLLISRVASIMLPTAGTALVDPRQIPVVANIDHIFAELEPAVRKQLAAGLALFDNMAVLSGGHGGRFVDLPDAAAQRYLNDWISSPHMPQRAIAAALTRLANTGYWSDPNTWPPVAYEGPVSRKWGIPSQGNAPLPA